eukprot:Tamp_13700.p1 GENE.Tamp_13700~~Tamp_13700.p1  ORF type:complete len:102 (-),score=1.67 Tamp_13700:554-859(-)
MLLKALRSHKADTETFESLCLTASSCHPSSGQTCVSHHHTYYVTSSYILRHHVIPLLAKPVRGKGGGGGCVFTFRKNMSCLTCADADTLTRIHVSILYIHL